MGVYPMLPDESCWFLAVDFDGENWQIDTRAFLESCERFEVPASLERSRSGNGGHVWIFFNQPVSASLARRMGSFLLTDAMDLRPELGFASYDRLFPNQDTLPKGGFGNLIALPLQKIPRDLGNSVFIDSDFSVYSDQWEFLSSIRKMTLQSVEAIVEEADKSGGILGVKTVSSDEDDFSLKPWSAPPSRKVLQSVSREDRPSSLEVISGDGLYIEKKALPPQLRNRIIRLGAFQNPDFYKAQAMRLSTYDKPRIINCAEDAGHYISLPRGCEDSLKSLCKELGIQLTNRDQRFAGRKIEVQFQGALRDGQQKAARALLKHDTGVLAATTAFGKTVLAAWMIAERGVNTLILVHRKQLMDQWVARLTEFLDIEEKEIGRLGGGRRKLKGKIDIATIQSLVRKSEVSDQIADYGYVIVDECHHISARSFELAIQRAKAKYITGLSATVIRKDGQHPIIFMQCGPVRYRVDALDEAKTREFRQNVIVRPTTFQGVLSEETTEDLRFDFLKLCEEIVNNPIRNQQIVTDVANAWHQKRNCLVLTERTDHLSIIYQQLESIKIPTVILRGGLSKKELNEALESISNDAQRSVILATGGFVGEGFDESRLDTLFITMPVSWKGTIAQYAGRLHRKHKGKTEVIIYDYADLEVPMLARMFDKRQRGYEAVGYTVTIPASALPGWPSEVPLPFDSEWKKDYIDSARRLIRDGVDVDLASLFAKAASQFPEDAKGVNRARSASESFLYQYLESRNETRGLFQLNGTLPISFGSNSEMEIDLLCRKYRIAIEIDGNQHLTPEAYRTDRYKDVLLQEGNYFVLRFLAGDIGKYLDRVLDRIDQTIQKRSGEYSISKKRKN